MSDPFPTTRWSLVLAAREQDTTRARDALSALCEAYWVPLYAFVRRRGYGADDARDLTQSYFVQVIEGHYLDIVDPGAGRFRAFLLHKIKHFLADERERARALKRGGGARVLPFEIAGPELTHDLALSDQRTPDRDFERRWAQTVVDRALGRLERDAAERGRGDEFRLLRGYLTGETSKIPYSQVAAKLEVSESAVKSAVRRLRKRLGQVMRDEIAHTVSDPDEIDDEMRHLLKVLE